MYQSKGPHHHSDQQVDHQPDQHHRPHPHQHLAGWPRRPHLRLRSQQHLLHHRLHLLSRTVVLLFARLGQWRQFSLPFEGLPEQSDELGVFEVVGHTARGQSLPHTDRVLATAEAGLAAVHEADGGEDETADVPGGGPVLLVVVGEAGADGSVGLEAAVGGVEEQLRGVEGVVLVQSQQSVVGAPREVALKIVEAEVEVPRAVPRDHHPRNRLPLQPGLLLLQSGEPHPFGLHVCLVIVWVTCSADQTCAAAATSPTLCARSGSCTPPPAVATLAPAH